MTLNEVEQEVFLKLLNEFIAKHGTEPLEDMFYLWRKFRKSTNGSVPVFPVSDIYYYVLFLEVQKEEYKSLTVRQKIERLKVTKDVSTRTIDTFIKKYFPEKNKKLNIAKHRVL